jgi:tetratricopeptide (TPR) repeat protein
MGAQTSQKRSLIRSRRNHRLGKNRDCETTDGEQRSLRVLPQGQILLEQAHGQRPEEIDRLFQPSDCERSWLRAGLRGLADAYVLLSGYAAATPADAFPKAKTAAQKALELDNNLAEAHTSLAETLAVYDYDFTRAITEFKRAIELNPNYATAHHWYGNGR